MDIARLGIRVNTGDLERGELALEAFASEAAATGQAVDRLEDGLTEAARAAGQFIDRQGRLRQQTGQFASTSQAAATGMQRFAAGARAADAANEALIVSNRRVRSSFGGLRGSITAFGLQSQDILVQAQAGVRESVIVAQQIPQLLGQVGGATGAIVGLGVAAGAIAFAPLIDGLFSSGEAAGDAEDAIEDLLDTFSRIQDNVDTAITPIQELREEFGRFAQQVRNDALFFAQLELDGLGGAVDDAVEAVRDPLSRFEALGAQLFDARANLDRTIQQQANGIATSEQVLVAREVVQGLDDDVEALAREFGVTRGELLLIISDLDDLANADGPGAIAEAAQQIIDNFQVLRTTNGEINGDFQAIAAAAGNVRDAAARLVTILGDTSDAAEQTGDALGSAADQGSFLASLDFGNIDAAATAAGQLAQQLGISVAAASRLSAIQQSNGSQRGLDRNGEVIFDPRDPRFDPLVAGQFQVGEAALTPDQRDRRNNTSSSGRGGGGRSGAEQLSAAARIAEQAIRQAEQAAVSFEQAQAELDARLDSGAITLDQYTGAVEELRERFEDTAQQSEFEQYITSISDALAAAIVQGEDLGESLRRVFQQIAQDLISSGIQTLLRQTFGGFGTGGGGGLFSGLFGGLFAGFRDSGGPIPSGQFGIVGERGPEIVSGPAMVTSRADTARILNGNGGGRVTVEVFVNDDGKIGAIARQEAGQVAVEVVQRNNTVQREISRRQTVAA